MVSVDPCGVRVFWDEEEAANLCATYDASNRPHRRSGNSATAWETWQERDARAAKRIETRLAAVEDDKCNLCGFWTECAAERLSLSEEDEVCECDHAALSRLLGPDASYPDLWGDDGSSRVIPFSPDLIEELRSELGSIDDHLCAQDDQEEGAIMAENLIASWAKTTTEENFLQALAAGHSQGEARRLSGLHRPETLLKRIRCAIGNLELLSR